MPLEELDLPMSVGATYNVRDHRPARALTGWTARLVRYCDCVPEVRTERSECHVQDGGAACHDGVGLSHAKVTSENVLVRITDPTSLDAEFVRQAHALDGIRKLSTNQSSWSTSKLVQTGCPSDRPERLEACVYQLFQRQMREFVNM